MGAKPAVASSVGIKELKDQASAIVDSVTRTRRAVTITKNNREVARIVPIESEKNDPYQQWIEMGLIRKRPQPWSMAKLIPLGLDASEAIAAIIADRDED